MFSSWFKNSLIALVLLAIAVPTEENSFFSADFFKVANQKFHFSIPQKHNTTDSLSEPEISSVDESATFVRSRCDFLDLVIGSDYSETFVRSFSFTKSHSGRDDIHHFLLSDFLLSLPPPIV